VGGAGLGLTIARTIIHAHGGDLALLDAEGGGLKIEVRLPKA
jgi:signal transduction histidine kinase